MLIEDTVPGAAASGRAVQIDRMRFKLKPRRTKRLKLKPDKSLFNFASILLSSSTCAAISRIARAFSIPVQPSQSLSIASFLSKASAWSVRSTASTRVVPAKSPKHILLWARSPNSTVPVQVRST